MGIAALMLGVALIIGLLVYVVREATILKTTAEALQQELAQFKQGGFQELVRGQLAELTHRATEELQHRDRQLLEQQQRATMADFGRCIACGRCDVGEGRIA